jgi:CubicO group peptidase (beta-lactamase class C family)
MQKLNCLCILLLAVSSFASAQTDKLERLMDYYVKHDNFNGAALIVRKGAVLLAKGYGYRDERTKSRNTENTIFELGTNTNLFTAEVIIQLDSKGKLGLDDKLVKYLPDYPNGDRISLKNLLSQTSGIYNYTNDPAFCVSPHYIPKSREEIIDRFKNQPLAFAPGAEYQNSNSNYFLLATVIEKIAHKKYEKEVKEEILFNCGMTHTGFDFLRLRDENKAIGYIEKEREKYTEAPAKDSLLIFSAGELYSSATDLLKYHRALLQHKLLPKDWQDLAYSPVRNQHAPCWDIYSIYNRKFMQHGGEMTGYRNYIIRQEDDDVLIVLLENVVRNGESDSSIANNILQCLYEKSYVLPGERKVTVAAERPRPTADQPENVKVKKPKPIDGVDRNRYVGDFEITPAYTLSFALIGNELYATSPDQKAIKMVQESETIFRAAGWNAEIEFVKSGNGSFNKIVLHQQDQLIPGVRTK